jgi:type I restriction enzyme M protein
MRNNMDAAEYKHFVLGLIFLKYISDAFEERHANLQKEMSQGADPEDLDEHWAANIFGVPSEARRRVSRPRRCNPSPWRIKSRERSMELASYIAA